MKKQNLKQKLVSLAAVPAVALGGCMSNDALKISFLDVEYERRAEIGTPEEHIPVVSEQIYKRSQVYEENKISQETVSNILNSSFLEAYRNRDKNDN